MSSRPSTAPDFLLSRGHGSVRTQGAVDSFDSIDDALAALRAGAEMIVGAVPFRRDQACALTVPARIWREDGPLEPHSYYRRQTVHGELVGMEPSMETHHQRVEAAIGTIKNSPLEKVVLARQVHVAFDPPVDPRLIASRLIDLSLNRDGFIADLSPAGEDFVGHWLVGSSPEVLVKRQGSTVTAYPLAGSAPRDAVRNSERDKEVARRLYSSKKDLEEHRFVVEHLRALLRPVCSNLSIPPYPELTATNEMWHLATPIAGTLRHPLSALELARIVHPTPAVCGTPTHAAEELISLAEGDRRFYAGAVGWCDSSGDGEYMVAIRCAEVTETTAVAWAGGGIVADSTAEEEVAETTAKLRTIGTALGLSL